MTRSLRDAPTLDAFAITRFTTRFTHTARTARNPVKWAVFAYVSGLALLLYPVVLLPAAVHQVRGRNNTTYVLRNDARRITAALTVRAGPGRWTITDHVTRRPGTGQGAALRAHLIPCLIAAADADGIDIEATTATRALAQAYTQTVPGLVDVGPARPVGRRLRRPGLPPRDPPA